MGSFDSTSKIIDSEEFIYLFKIRNADFKLLIAVKIIMSDGELIDLLTL
jgi:hypothetical protein